MLVPAPTARCLAAPNLIRPEVVPPMLAYIIRRVFVGVMLLIVMSLVTFLLFFASPVDPARYACGKNCSPQLREQTRKALGYDKPTVVQWTDFLKGVVVGRQYPDDPELAKKAPETVADCPAPCFGYSVVNTTTVNARSRRRSPSRCRSRSPRWCCGWSAGCSSGSWPRSNGHVHRPRHRGPRAGALRLPGVLHRPLPPEVPRHQVAVGRVSRSTCRSPTEASSRGSRGCSCRGSPWPSSSWPATSG